MRHARLFAVLLGLLLISGGGIFVLLAQREEVSEIPTETVVASVRMPQAELQTQEEVVEEGGEEVREVRKSVLPAKSELKTQEHRRQPQPPLAAQKAGEEEQTPTKDSDANEPQPTRAPQPFSLQPQPAPPPAQSSPPPSPASFPININIAGSEELQALEGIGPVLAQRIIEYRESISLFYAVEDMKKVKGIGEVNFEKMKHEITVGDVEPASQPPPLSPQSEPDVSSNQTAPPDAREENHIFYTSSYHSSKYYYCDTDSAWKNLSEKYLESYPSPQALLAKYPEKTLHEPCQ